MKSQCINDYEDYYNSFVSGSSYWDRPIVAIIIDFLFSQDSVMTIL